MGGHYPFPSTVKSMCGFACSCGAENILDKQLDSCQMLEKNSKKSIAEYHADNAHTMNNDNAVRVR